jgi:hypothetical protein
MVWTKSGQSTALLKQKGRCFDVLLPMVSLKRVNLMTLFSRTFRGNWAGWVTCPDTPLMCLHFSYKWLIWGQTGQNSSRHPHAGFCPVLRRLVYLQIQERPKTPRHYEPRASRTLTDFSPASTLTECRDMPAPSVENPPQILTNLPSRTDICQ